MAGRPEAAAAFDGVRGVGCVGHASRGVGVVRRLRGGSLPSGFVR